MTWLIDYVENMPDIVFQLWWWGLRTLPVIMVMSNYEFSKKRIARKPFIFLTIGFVTLAFVFNRQMNDSDTTVDWLIFFACYFVLWAVFVYFTSYRLKDIGNSRWWLVLMLIPYLSIGLALYGCIARQDYIRNKKKK